MKCLQRGLGGLDVLARDREQQLGASRRPAAPGGLGRAGLDAAVTTERLQFLDLVQGALEEGDEWWDHTGSVALVGLDIRARSPEPGRRRRIASRRRAVGEP
jgi:hypothetical protein